MPAKKPPLEERFFDFVDKTETCWLWTGTTTNGGYGVVYDNVVRRTKTAHAWSFEFHNETTVPAGQEVDHTCEVLVCVNPQHLEAVSHLENVQRWNAKRSHCKRGHLFDEKNTYITPKGTRTCRKCCADRRRESRRTQT